AGAALSAERLGEGFAELEQVRQLHDAEAIEPEGALAHDVIDKRDVVVAGDEDHAPGELALVDGVEEGAPRGGGAAIGDVAGDEDDVGVAERRRVEHALELA